MILGKLAEHNLQPSVDEGSTPLVQGDQPMRTSHLTWPCLSYVNLRQFKRKLLSITVSPTFLGCLHAYIRLVSNPRRTVAMLVTADIRNVLERTSSSSL